MAKGVFKRIGGHAVPVGREGRDALFAIADGAQFVAEFKTARNPEQHELFWSLCHLVAETTDSTKESVKRWLLLKTGFTEMTFMPDGSMEISPRSIAWESMEQAEFNSFFQAAVPKCAELLGSAPADVWQAFNDLLDPNTRANLKRLRRQKSPSIAPTHPEREKVSP